jgi:uridine kinase
MSSADPAEFLIERVAKMRAARAADDGSGSAVVWVALDGRSGAGKSTLAVTVGAALEALVIDGDDFYSGGADTYWDALGPQEKMDLVIDWRRQRRVLEALREGGVASWRPYDWEADDGRLGREVAAGPAQVVILDGAYSARPELADLMTLRVLLDPPRAVRRARLLGREGARYRAEWEARWSEAEDLYFERVMPPGAFDLVLQEHAPS